MPTSTPGAPAPRPAHRPAKLAGGKAVKVYLDPGSLEAARRIGVSLGLSQTGAVSAGIREALRLAQIP